MSDYKHEVGPKLWISGGILSFSLPEPPLHDTCLGSPLVLDTLLLTLKTVRAQSSRVNVAFLSHYNAYNVASLPNSVMDYGFIHH